MFTILSLFGSSFWEKDFIVNEILPSEYEFRSVKIDDTFEDSKYIVIFSSATISCKDIIDFCKKVNPYIVFHLSDKFGVNPEYTEVSKYTKLYVRNYHHSGYPNVDAVYMPLGYHSDMITCRSLELTHVPSSKRHIGWSFIGEIRENRKRMIHWFKKINIRKPYCLQNGISPSEMFKLHSESIFVPSERGHISLDCFRIYEACVAGAIPVVVGPATELDSTFKQEESPPWIFANTWSNAIMCCTALARNPDDLDRKQQQIIEWWKHRITKLRLKVLEPLQSC